MSLSIVTRAGAVTLDQPPAAGQGCDTCTAAPAQVRIAVDVNGLEVLEELALCGYCLVDALADHYTRRAMPRSGTLRKLADVRDAAVDDDPLALEPYGPTE